MLNPFPILFLAPLGYTLLRLTIGLVLLILARRQLQTYTQSTPRLLSLLIVTEVITAGVLILGIGTQIAAIVTFCIACVLFWYRRHPAIICSDVLIPLLLWGCSLTMILTGAGVIAFDLPI